MSVPAPAPPENATSSLRVIGGYGGRQLGENPTATGHSDSRWTDDSA